MRRIAAAAVLALPLSAVAQVENFTIDPYHTYPGFALDYMGFATLTGRFDRTTGKFSIDRAGKKASVELAVETASVNTGDSDKGARARTRDDHLRTADFFNVAEFPRMTFRSANVKFNGDVPAEIDGQLTLLGVTKPVTLKVDRWTCKDHPFYKKPSCAGNVSGVIRRSEFGMKFLVPGIGDEVRLSAMFLGFRD